MTEHKHRFCVLTHKRNPLLHEIYRVHLEKSYLFICIECGIGNIRTKQAFWSNLRMRDDA